jgi:hypothetical protein
VLDFRLSVGEGQALSFHIGASPLLRDLVDMLIRDEEGATSTRQEYDKLFWKLPLAVGVRGLAPEGKDPAEEIVALVKSGGLIDLLDGEPSVARHREVKLHRLPINADKYREFAKTIAGFVALARQQDPGSPVLSMFSLLPSKEAPAALYVAVIDGSAQVSANEALIKSLIDDADARKKDGGKKPADVPRESSAALFISPANMRDAANLFLEYEGHCLALLNNQAWNCFHQCGLLASDASDAKRRKTALQYLGFIPVSADGTTYRHDARRAEVANARHGTHRRPELKDRVAEGSELAKLLDEIRSLRAELRFHEDGLHTVLTIERR